MGKESTRRIKGITAVQGPLYTYVGINAHWRIRHWLATGVDPANHKLTPIRPVDRVQNQVHFLSH